MNITGNMVSWDSAAATSWQGEAASRFTGAVSDLRDGMTKGSQTLDGAAAALTKLAAHLEHAQDAVKKLAVKVRDAERAADEAEARAALAAVASAGAATGLKLFGPDPPAGLVDAKAHAADAAASARTSAATAREHAVKVREHAEKHARELCHKCRHHDRVTAETLADAATAAPASTGEAAMPGAHYATSVARRMTVSDFKELAFLRAGIDPTKWNPEEGLDANDKTVRAVYAYYRKLAMERGEFQWMKMAAIGGPLFYAGFKDMDAAGDFVQMTGSTINSPFGVRSGPGVFGEFEHTFLKMQKAIFSDLAWQHEAFVLGGSDAIFGAVKKLSPSQQHAALDRTTRRAWKQMESIDPDEVAAGNFSLILREQGPVIQRYYRHLQDESGALTGALTDRADTPIPGSKTYSEYSDKGNIANFKDRIAWIRDTLWPAHQKLIHTPGAAEKILAGDFDSQVDDYRQLTPEALADELVDTVGKAGQYVLPSPIAIP